jgi:hypothetical protein
MDAVRIGDLEFARWFTAYYNRGPGFAIEYELDIEIIDGAPVCVAIRNPAGITASHGLRKDLGNLDELVKQAATWAQKEPGDKQPRPLLRGIELRRARQAIKRRHYDDDHHRRVLDLADEAKALGKRQDIHVAEELGLLYATARTQIRRARDALGER